MVVIRAYYANANNNDDLILCEETKRDFPDNRRDIYRFDALLELCWSLKVY